MDSFSYVLKYTTSRYEKFFCRRSKMFVDIEQQKEAINPRQWNFIEEDDERIWKGFRHACHQNKGLSPRRSLTNDKTRARNFNKILIIYLQQQLRSFTSQTEANFGGIISLVLVATLPISLEYLDVLIAHWQQAYPICLYSLRTTLASFAT